MASNTALDVTSLDFNTIKTSLKNYLSSQTEFLDYDFDGSNMSILLDILSYNTHLNAFYLNMATSEMFLDSAVLKDSVLSHAKELNYVPTSRRSSSAIVNIEIFPANTPASITIAKGTEFRTLVGGNGYTFTTASDIVVTNTGNGYLASNVEIFEGKFVSDLFQVNTAISNQTFVVSDNKIDTRSISVAVRDSNTSTTNTIYTKASTTLGLTDTSEVFFIEPAANNLYEVKFGDGVISKQPGHGNVVEVNYRVSQGVDPNTANTFKLAGSVSGHSNVSVTTVLSATGGAERETAESIKFNAPRYYQTRERAVTNDDYVQILKQNFSEIENMISFGGDELTPPKFGRTVLSIDLVNAEGVPDIKKHQYLDFIKEKVPAGITPIIVDPQYVYLALTTEVKYNVNQTSLTSDDIKTKVSNTISTFNTSSLNSFNITYRHSKLTAAIDAADTSIVSNETTVIPFVKIAPTDLTTNFINEYEFNVPIRKHIGITANSVYSNYNPSVYSTGFVSNTNNVYLEDDGLGNIELVTTTTSGSRQVINGYVGSVNYDSGVVNLFDLKIDSYTGDGIKLYIITKEKDISVVKNNILTMDTSNQNITITGVRE